MNRRGFMAGILTLATAPAIVKAGSIMRINPAISGWVNHDRRMVVGSLAWSADPPYFILPDASLYQDTLPHITEDEFTDLKAREPDLKLLEGRIGYMEGIRFVVDEPYDVTPLRVNMNRRYPILWRGWNGS